jgi:hypothetical protein
MATAEPRRGSETALPPVGERVRGVAPDQRDVPGPAFVAEVHDQVLAIPGKGPGVNLRTFHPLRRISAVR